MDIYAKLRKVNSYNAREFLKLKENYDEYKKLETERITALSNEDLYREAIELSGGDDYDGCFSAEGEIQYPLLMQELDSRLFKNGFIKN
jgi:hypothetical protein